MLFRFDCAGSGRLGSGLRIRLDVSVSRGSGVTNDKELSFKSLFMLERHRDRLGSWSLGSGARAS